MKKAVIFAPFWRQAGHVGNYRVDRFVRWLVADGFYIVVVRAGSVSGRRPEPWGVELTVRDPLGLYRDVAPDSKPDKTRKSNRLRRLLVYWLFNPDPGILWARRAAKHPTILEHAVGASFVLSSSPPESAHVGAAILAKKMKAELIIDMRDGWIDEPLKSLLRTSRIQRWRESRFENGILRQAKAIFVTSSVWKSLLLERLPFTQDKTVVLTNGYPPDGLFDLERTRKRTANEPLRLVHAGRFTGSRSTQRVSYLLEPLLLGLENRETCGVVTLLGRLEVADIKEVAHWQPQFKSKGWTVEVKGAVSRDEMMVFLCQADGLLLLSASLPVIPSKFYEYLVAKKPVLAVTPKDSAVWSIGNPMPQIFLSEAENASDAVVHLFLAACTGENRTYEIPEEFSEAVLSALFIKHIKPS